MSCETSLTYGPITSAISAIRLLSIGRPDRVLLSDDPQMYLSHVLSLMRGARKLDELQLIISR